MIRQLFFVFLLIHSTMEWKASAKNHQPLVKPPDPLKKKWLTLNGGEPVIVARGGNSGLFPESSKYAYEFANMYSQPGTVEYCDVQMTKDNVAVCGPFQLQTITNIDERFKGKEKTYNVYGKDIQGWFSIDYTAKELFNTSLKQNVITRQTTFDLALQMWSPDDIANMQPISLIWLNIENDLFFNEHKLSPKQYIVESPWNAAYISSPEIDFLKSMGPKANRDKTKLIFKFLEYDSVEPTSKEKYGVLLEKLPAIKQFASGILVPKEYIWPVGKDKFLQPSTSLVEDAHKAGLEIYAAGFANDDLIAFNYSYDPSSEYLNFVDNSQFSVDGVLTDFPTTASGAISCLAHNHNATIRKNRPLIISHNGASGDFPSSSDLAYQKAIDGGVDVIDCSVQLSKDGVAFCVETADLIAKTTAASQFMDLSRAIPEIQTAPGIFSFDLAWSDIQTLKPQFEMALKETDMPRNPAHKNKGKLLTLTGFLELAKTKATRGVLINIQNAAYLASKQGFDIIDIVLATLKNATLDKQQVMIQSDDSSVLSKFKDVPSYQRVLSIKEIISDAPRPVAEEVKKYADAVVIEKISVVVSNKEYYAVGFTNVVKNFNSVNVSVYVRGFTNEFVTLLFDYNSDPYYEVATFDSFEINGLIMDFPATGVKYYRSPCSDVTNDKLPFVYQVIQPRGLTDLVASESQAPAEAPLPALTDKDVLDPPLPPVAKKTDVANTSTPPLTDSAPPPKTSAGHPTNLANMSLSVLSILLIALTTSRD